MLLRHHDCVRSYCLAMPTSFLREVRVGLGNAQFQAVVCAMCSCVFDALDKERTGKINRAQAPHTPATVETRKRGPHRRCRNFKKELTTNVIFVSFPNRSKACQKCYHQSGASLLWLNKPQRP